MVATNLVCKTVLLFFISVVGLYAQTASGDKQTGEALVELGRRLFYDADLSINGTMSCATCHEQRRAFTDGNRVHPGALGDPGKRNIPTLANVGMYKNLTWAHNALSGLAEQSTMPIRGTDPIEMGMHGVEGEIAKRLGQNECYQKLFLIAFGEEKGAINLSTVTRALEGFEKTMVSNNSIYDQKIQSHKPLPSKDAEDGKKLFFKSAKCNSCHSAPLFSDDNFHNVQSETKAVSSSFKDFGLSGVTGNPKDKNFFRTPSLRNVVLTAPYWHDGSIKTLSEAIRKHNLKTNQALSVKDMDKIIVFLQTLTDVSFINNPQFAKPNKECGY